VCGCVVHQLPLFPPVVLLVSLPDEPVVDGTLKSCVLCVIAVDAAATDGVVLALLGSVLAGVLVAVVDPVGDEIKLIPLVDPAAELPTDRLPAGIAALSLVAAAPSVANRPELYAVADGSDPAVTEKFSVPSLEISHGAPEAGVPPSRLIPIT
jgi:hypothetical protein